MVHLPLVRNGILPSLHSTTVVDITPLVAFFHVFSFFNKRDDLLVFRLCLFSLMSSRFVDS